jgi:filamentous hemagglutinin family protein
VGEGDRVYFASPNGIESILSRVTGSSSSNILGTLGVAGPADLYLINPHGVVFGRHVNLDVAGALYVTTADAIALADSSFSATTPHQGQLLAVRPNTLFSNYLTANSGDITVQGQINPAGNLTLAANSISVEGRLRPGQNLFLTAADKIQFRGVADQTQSGAFTNIEQGRAGIGGNIQITATHLDVLDGAQINSGTAGQGNAGNIDLNIRETLRFSGWNPLTQRPSSASSSVEKGGEGQGGTLNIQAGNLEIIDGAQLRSVVAGRGNAGDVTIQIRESARFVGDAPTGNEQAGIINDVEGEGQGGDILLHAANLDVLDGAQFSSDLLGRGNSGQVIVRVNNTARFVGSENPTARVGGVFSRVTTTGEGQGGNISISAANSDVLNGAQLSSELSGLGNAGALRLSIAGTARFGGSGPSFTSGAFSRVDSKSEGQGGNLHIIATNLDVVEGARLSASTSGQGNAGNILLEIGQTARFAGRSALNGEPGGAFSNVQPTGAGQSGDINLTARNLAVVDGAQLSAAVQGRGNAGDVVLKIADTAYLEGAPGAAEANSGLYSSVAENGQGQSGEIILSASNLVVNGGAQITTAVFGQGNAGNITLAVADTASFQGNGGVFSNVATSGAGQSGRVNITAANLALLDGARVSTAVAGRGNAGDVTLTIGQTARLGNSEVSQAELGDRTSNPLNPPDPQRVSGIFSSIDATGEGQGRDIYLTAGSLTVTDGARLSTELAGKGNAGNVILTVGETARLEGSGSAVSSQVQENAEGGGGNVSINARNLSVNQGAMISASNEGRGNAGNIALRVRDRLQAQNGTIGTNSTLGAGGQIQIDGGLIVLQGDSDIQSFVNNGGDRGGNIAITANAVVVLDDSDIFAFSPDGQGGAIDLSQTTLFSQNQTPVSDKRLRAELLTLEGNNQANISAAGGTSSGPISISTANVVENDLADLPNTLVDSDQLLANSCIARRLEGNGNFIVSGRDRLPQTPTEALPNAYPVGTVQPIPTSAATPAFSTVTEPSAVYQLADGRLVMNRDCES